MKYAKPPLTLDQQVDLLLSRGMAGDRSSMRARFAVVNYYRLSGYWHPFKSFDDSFVPGTEFDLVWRRYVFDRRLRLLVMDAIERIEVAVRALLAYEHAHRHGAFGYAEDPRSLPKLSEDPDRRRDFMQRLRRETARSHEVFATHFRGKYGDAHPHFPVWIATELMSFGTVLTFYGGATHQVKQAVATRFSMPEVVLHSWLLTLNTIRNICAHHGRLWNRELGIKPKIPRQDNYPQWHEPIRIENTRTFAVLTICQAMLQSIAPGSSWSGRVRTLLSEFPEVPKSLMGFPEGWHMSPLWSDTGAS